ncbi:MAG: hypothetical protein MGU50_14170 [Trichodesmium sp. MAG_R02]|nr:hypothetical protein [Trichodesmium sp. MAG_R02]
MANTSGRKFLPSDLWTQERSRKFVILGAPSLGVELILILNSAVNQENYCKRLAKEKVRN